MSQDRSNELAGPASSASPLLVNAQAPVHGAWDEMRHADCALRPTWARFAAKFEGAGIPAGTAGAAALAQRKVRLADQLQCDGITYNQYGKDRRDARPWSLELLPLLIDYPEWTQIEAGVVQRAELIEALLADCYGARRLQAEGLLPDQFLSRHPGWMRSLIGHPPAGGRHVYVLAFDLGREPDGVWSVLAQSTHRFSGLAYALHNRTLISSQFPDALRELAVRPVADALRSVVRVLQDAATVLADRAGHGAPRLVLLAPGPANEAYFEHAYTASQFGLTLTDGRDLTILGNQLFLQTVEGLEPVHGVLRRLDDAFCDPLELRADSVLGVPGMMAAARAGTFVMANAFGSSFVESPTLLAFLPPISERLLGQPLLMRSLSTWWCGQPSSWAAVRGNLCGKALRATFDSGHRTPPTLQDPSLVEAVVSADPAAWTVQDQPRLSRAPVYSDDGLVTRPAVLRVYASVDHNGLWQVMPGGLTRVATREGASFSSHEGGSSLDTWVLGEPGSPRPATTVKPQPLGAHQRRCLVTHDTGEKLFWLGRYTERCQQQLRLVQAALTGLGAGPLGSALTLLALSHGLLRDEAQPTGQAVLAGLIDSQGGGLAQTLTALEGLGGDLRQCLADDHWRWLTRLHRDFMTAQVPHGADPAGALAALETLGTKLELVLAAQTAAANRDDGWRLTTCGRLVERLNCQALTLRALLDPTDPSTVAGGGPGIVVLLALFESRQSCPAQIRRHDGAFAIGKLLALDETHPYSLASTLAQLRSELALLPAVLRPEAVLALLPPSGVGLNTLDAATSADAFAGMLVRLACDLEQRSATVSDRLGEIFARSPEWSLRCD
ncbi:circularly permuted type 2 ATP-grasp protein [Roseateles sp. DC23W]|uniref:Circularly permuted type 2 ATP-grasp protein n=1 Tax=Pelomonas dachongensis TaxID=3299029 RepID=A0ABW7EUS7_9BURK